MRSQIDMHTHSIASDGTFTPAKVAQKVQEAGLKAWALTDHDNVNGIAEAAMASDELGLEFVPGIEISAEFPRPGWMHVLGYFVDYEDAEFLKALEDLQESRRDRNPRIIAKLNELGLAITMEEVQEEAGGPGAQVGRPHFAAVMVAKGLVSSTQEAFDNYLAKGKPAYAEKRRLSAKESVELILSAGGIPVLAHPFSLMKDDGEPLAQVLKELEGYGLMGVEAHYPLHDPEFTQRLLDLAQELDLIVTGGSDFHGATKPEIQLGSGREDNLVLEYGLLDGLKLKRPQ